MWIAVNEVTATGYTDIRVPTTGFRFTLQGMVIPVPTGLISALTIVQVYDGAVLIAEALTTSGTVAYPYVWKFDLPDPYESVADNNHLMIRLVGGPVTTYSFSVTSWGSEK